MADLGDLLGTLMASLVRARQVADEATAAAAERYRQHPLLEGMSIPRVRIPELTVELPVLLKADDPGEAAEPNTAKDIASQVRKALEGAAERRKLKVPTELLGVIEKRVSDDVDVARTIPEPTGPGAIKPLVPFTRPIAREGIGRLVERDVLEDFRAQKLVQLQETDLAELIAAARSAAVQAADKKPARPPSITASVLTAEVKDQAGAGNATRIVLTLREEGLEWTSTVAADGTTRRRLTPE